MDDDCDTIYGRGAPSMPAEVGRIYLDISGVVRRYLMTEAGWAEW